MKKLLILTDESVLGGCAKSGVAEVADSLANAMTPDYTVSVVCPDGGGVFVRMAANLRPYAEGVRTCRLFGVDYYLVDRPFWPERALALVDGLAPDILHSFAAPELLGKLERRPARCVYTIDQADFVRDKPEALAAYDTVTTVSETYARELLEGGDALAETLAGLDFQGITNGILTPVFAPEKGLLVSARYSAGDQSGKAVCKARLLRTYGIPGDPCLYLMMCRLVRDKGLDEVLEAVHAIRDSGGFTVIVGRGDRAYEPALCLDPCRRGAVDQQVAISGAGHPHAGRGGLLPQPVRHGALRPDAHDGLPVWGGTHCDPQRRAEGQYGWGDRRHCG